MAADLDGLLAALNGARRLLIVIHDNPDPDALAAACALGRLVKEKAGLASRITCEGIVGRAENHAMIRELRIKLMPVHRVNWRKWPCVAMVDAQPGAGNNSLPRGVTPRIVLDHHPLRRQTRARFLDVRPDYGACATIVEEYYTAAALPIPPDLAAGLCYAVFTDTQDLAREASPSDTAALLRLYPLADLRALGRIRHPRLGHSYYSELARALLSAFAYGNIIGSHLGAVEHPDSVSLTADLLLQRERIGWSIVTGRWRGDLYVSLRARPGRHHAGEILARVLGRAGHAGGHDTMAGGRVPLGDRTPEAIEAFQQEIVASLIWILKRRKDAVVKPLVESKELIAP